MPQVEISEKVWSAVEEARKLINSAPDTGAGRAQRPTMELPAFVEGLLRVGLNTLLAAAYSASQRDDLLRVLQDLAWRYPDKVYTFLQQEGSKETFKVADMRAPLDAVPFDGNPAEQLPPEGTHGTSEVAELPKSTEQKVAEESPGAAQFMRGED